MATVTSNPFNVTVQEAVGDTELARVVSGLAVGGWGVLDSPSGTSIDTLFQSGYPTNNPTTGIFEYATRMPWDALGNQAVFYGGNDSGAGMQPKSIKYDEVTNEWSRLPDPPSVLYEAGPPGTDPRHAYGMNVLDVENRKWYTSRRGYDTREFWSTSLDNPSASWGTEANITVGVGAKADGVAFAEFPQLDALFMFCGEGVSATGGYRAHGEKRNNTTGEWSHVWSDPDDVAAPSNHMLVDYSGAHIPGQEKDGCIIFGGGGSVPGAVPDKNKRFWRYNPDGSVDPIDPFPYAANQEVSSKFTLVTRDHATENLLYMHDDEVYQYFLELDPRKNAGEGGWTLLTYHSPAVSANDGDTFRSAATGVDNYMVNMFAHLDESGSGSKVWIYKHAESMTVDEVAADADTLAVLDFETTGRCKEAEAFYSRPSLSPTITDPYLLNHPNASNFLDGNNKLESWNYDRQLSANWNVPWLFMINPNNPVQEPIRYPKVVSGDGEFADVDGETHSCLEIKLRAGDEEKGGGELAVLLRDQGIGEAKPAGGWTFLTAGTGAEIWIRAAVWHDENWINTRLQIPGGSQTGAKLWNIHGHDSSGSLEETITTNTDVAPGFYHVYSNGGAENYDDPSPSVYQQSGWRVMHMQIIVGDDGVSNGIVRCYLDEDTEPFFETTSSTMSSEGLGPLTSGWQSVATDTEAINQGYWVYDFTTFTTGKDTNQSHPEMTRRYDNIVIRKNTRCPPLRPGRTIPVIPAQGDWSSETEVLSATAGPAWDTRISGMISPADLVISDGTFYLYYIGADGDRPDGGPANRKLGVATSTDGINFIKYASNPIITFSPTGGVEEGIFSATVFKTAPNQWYCYYGGMNETSPGSVDSEGRLATSTDGLTWVDQGVVIPNDPGITWGASTTSELYPIGAFEKDGTYYCYYTIGEGSAPQWSLGLASGPAADNLTTFQEVIDTGWDATKDVRGGGDVVQLDNDTAVIFLVEGTDPQLYVRARQFSYSNPAALSDPTESWGFSDRKHSNVAYDTATRSWYLIQRGDNDPVNKQKIFIRTA